jgi:hypothetical protein
MPRCNVCGTSYEPGDWRCEGELDDGSRCGADLADQGDGNGDRAALGGGR